MAKQSALLQRRLAAGLAAAALFGSGDLRADEKSPAAWLLPPRAKGVLDLPVLPPLTLPSETKPVEMKKDELLVPVQGAELVEPAKVGKSDAPTGIVEVPKLEIPKLEIPETKPILQEPEIVKAETPKSTPAPVRKEEVNPTKVAATPTAPAMYKGKPLATTGTRWSTFEERMGGAPQMKAAEPPRNERILPDPIAVSPPAGRFAPGNNAVAIDKPTPLPASEKPVSQQAGRNNPEGVSTSLDKPTPLPANQVASRPSMNDPYLAGTVVPREGGTVFRSGFNPPVKETPRYTPPSIDQSPILAPRPPAPVGALAPSSVVEKPIEVPVLVVPEVSRLPATTTASRALPDVKPQTAKTETADKQQQRMVPAAQPAATVKTETTDKPQQRTVSAPIAAPRAIGDVSTYPAVTGRPMTLLMNTDPSGRWTSGAPAPVASKTYTAPQNLAAKPPERQPDTKVVQASKSTPAQETPAKAAANPATDIPASYSLLPWQWAEKVRTVAGPGAANLVCLLSNRGEVKIKFECADPTEAQSIAGRISAIPEFRKLAIDFEINGK